VSGRACSQAREGTRTHSRLGDDVVVCEVGRQVGKPRSVTELSFAGVDDIIEGEGKRGEGRTELEGDAAEGRAVLGDVEEDVLQGERGVIRTVFERAGTMGKRTLMLGAVERPRRKMVDIGGRWGGVGASRKGGKGAGRVRACERGGERERSGGREGTSSATTRRARGLGAARAAAALSQSSECADPAAEARDSLGLMGWRGKEGSERPPTSSSSSNRSSASTRLALQPLVRLAHCIVRLEKRSEDLWPSQLPLSRRCSLTPPHLFTYLV